MIQQSVCDFSWPVCSRVAQQMLKFCFVFSLNESIYTHVVEITKNFSNLHICRLSKIS